MKPKVVIVAGGLAKRMRPVTEDIPKCLIELDGKPLIQHQIEFFRKRGYRDFIFCVAHLAERVKRYFGNGSSFGVNIEYSEEGNRLLGTAGAVKLIQPKVKDTMIIYYGDSLTAEDFDDVLEFHRSVKSEFTIIVRELPEGHVSSSIITIDGNKRIKVFLEKPEPGEFGKFKDEKTYINNGIYVMEPEIFEEIPENEECDFARDVIPKLLEKKMRLYAYVSNKFFREIGRIEKYEKFKSEITHGKIPE